MYAFGNDGAVRSQVQLWICDVHEEINFRMQMHLYANTSTLVFYYACYIGILCTVMLRGVGNLDNMDKTCVSSVVLKYSILYCSI